jgi:two-component system cell cycle response regulator DivK
MREMKIMKKILVVDDNETNLYLIRFILQKSGHEVIEARDGLEGVKLALEEKPDLVIMDIQLPGIDGHEATRRIRGKESEENLPIIALTSFAMPIDKELSLAAGCNSYLTKPIDVQTFVAEVNRYLAEMQNKAVESKSAKKE